jgi:hypothetical protein
MLVHRETVAFRAILAGFLVLGSAAGIASAAIQTQPNSLNPGDQYRLVFVTSTTTSGYASSGTDGNNIVQARADAVPQLAQLGATWKMIGSTSTVSARENTETDPVANGAGVPIFLIWNSTLIASDYSDLWDGNLQADLNYTELGTQYNGRVWTGDVENGLGESQYFGHPSGTLFGNSAPSTGTTIPVIPQTGQPGRNGWMFDWTMDSFQPAALYAMSSLLTIPTNPGVVPEATSLLTWGLLALAGFGTASGRRSRS